MFELIRTNSRILTINNFWLVFLNIYIYLFRYIHIWRIHEQKVPKIIWIKWFSAWIVLVFLDGRHASSEIWWILLRLISSLWFSKDRSKSSRGDEARRERWGDGDDGGTQKQKIYAKSFYIRSGIKEAKTTYTTRVAKGVYYEPLLKQIH